MRLRDVPRNDVAKAIAFQREQFQENGALSVEDSRVLARLQDDPAAFFAAPARLRRELKIPADTVAVMADEEPEEADER